jgi:hypothetical protein
VCIGRERETGGIYIFYCFEIDRFESNIFNTEMMKEMWEQVDNASFWLYTLTCNKE